MFDGETEQFVSLVTGSDTEQPMLSWQRVQKGCGDRLLPALEAYSSMEQLVSSVIPNSPCYHGKECKQVVEKYYCQSYRRRAPV